MHAYTLGEQQQHDVDIDDDSADKYDIPTGMMMLPMIKEVTAMIQLLWFSDSQQCLIGGPGLIAVLGGIASGRVDRVVQAVALVVIVVNCAKQQKINKNIKDTD